MKLPKELTTITPISKLLAMILFVSLPVVGFIVGMRHQQIISSPTIITNYPTPSSGCYYIENPEAACPKKDCGKILICPTPVLDETANWKTYKNDKLSISYPETWQIDNSSIALLYPGIAFRSKDYEIEKSGNLNLINGYSVSLRIQNVPWGIPGSPGDENITPLFTKETRWLNEKAWLREYNYEGIETILTTIHKNVPYQMIMESASYDVRKNNESLFIQVANTLKIK